MAVPVLHVCDKFGVGGSSIHGVSRLFSWWFPRYDTSRFEVSLCGLKRAEPASELLQRGGVPVTHLGRGPFDPRILSDLVSLGRRRGVKLLHVHGYAAADFGRLAASYLGAAVVLHEHFADPKMPAYQGLADRVLARRTDCAIAVSASTRDFLVKKRHVPAERVRVIWNGAPLDEFAAPAPGRAEELRRIFGLPEGAPIVGCVGRLSGQKGHRYLLEAAPRVLEHFAEARFLLVGDGDQLAALRSQSEQLGIERRIVFAGHQTDIPGLLGVMDVLCISSTYEGTPLALFEAMAAGKAIVSTAVDGCREVLEDGVTGLLVPPRDSESLAAALLRVLQDPTLRLSLARRAHEASARYDVMACVRSMEALYDEVLACRRAN